jgi:hypothetical protein
LTHGGDARLRDLLRRRPRPLDQVLPRQPRYRTAVPHRELRGVSDRRSEIRPLQQAHLPELIGREVPPGPVPWPQGEIAFLVEDPDAKYEGLRDSGVTILTRWRRSGRARVFPDPGADSQIAGTRSRRWRGLSRHRRSADPLKPYANRGRKTAANPMRGTLYRRSARSPLGTTSGRDGRRRPRFRNC